MSKNRTYNKRNLLWVLIFAIMLTVALIGRLVFLMIYEADYYGQMAKDVRERERSIKAQRGIIYDRNGIVLASNEPVCTISVIYNQITDPEKVISILSSELELSEDTVRKKVEKYSAIERIKANVDKEVADRIRNYDLDGVMVDEDYKRYYPYDDLASKVIGFTGADNQGIIGLEVEYDKYLKGTDGTILTVTTANGVELENEAENRIEPIEGYNLNTSIDVNIQKYAWQTAKKVCQAKQAKSVKVIIMNPQNGEIYAMVNEPEFNLNEPYTFIPSINESDSSENTNNLLNEMWRNACISDTYEPGSTFKVITATAALEEGAVKVEDTFSCPGYKIVEDRRIKCHKVGGHGAETFLQGIMNSCNPVFIEVGQRVGAENMYKYYEKLGLFNKTGVDVPGEANSIMHKVDNIGAVELATISFGQSIQITPMQLLVAVSSVINGGTLVTPHFGLSVTDNEGNIVKKLEYPVETGVVSTSTTETMKKLLEAVVAEGGGINASVQGQRIGGKTATSEKLPRGTGKYISSFLGFAPADTPEYIGIILIDEPVGIYYGGTIAAPVFAEIFHNILNTNLIIESN